MEAPLNVCILEPSGKPNADALATNVAYLSACGLQVAHECAEPDPAWPLSAASAAERARRLTDALSHPDIDYVLAARGGYGASDLLPLLDWARIGAAKPRPVVGFSDITAIQSALFSTLGWAGLHAPMPGSPLFARDGGDIAELITLLTTGLPWQGDIPLSVCEIQSSAPIEGWLFGGCLSVLTNLIATPWFPKDLSGAVVFLEDVNEPPGRVARYWTQWQQSGVANGLSAVVLGTFSDPCNDPQGKLQHACVREIAARSTCPVFHAPVFGHAQPNRPLALGARARIDQQRLRWQLTNFKP